MNPSSLLSYYPTYGILDEVITSKPCNNLNIFIDLKNVLQTVYMEHAILGILAISDKSKFVDTSVFNSVISFLSFHKIYSAKRNKNINFYIFFETGQSMYHKNIDKMYKISRRIDNLYGLDSARRAQFFDILQKNYQLLEKSCNKMPNIKVIRLQHLEADFVPYYLIRNKLVDSENSLNLIYSNDHDMMQNLSLNDNTFIFHKTPKLKRVIKPKEAMTNLLKTENNFPDNYFPFAMAILGDAGDDVKGVKGIGGKTLHGILEELVQLCGGIDKINDNVFNGLDLFPPDISSYENKYIDKIIDEERANKTISNNLKLVSFEMLSRMLDHPKDTAYIEKRNYIYNILESKEIYPLEAMNNALTMTGVYLEREDLMNIYFQLKNNINEEVQKV